MSRWQGVPRRERTDLVVLHHLVAPVTTTAAQVDEWHRARGWAGIGYHYVVRFDARHDGWVVEPGRPLPLVGAHAPPRNHDSVGVAVAGDWREPPERWQEAVYVASGVVRGVCSRYGLDLVTAVAPHWRVGSTPTECPGHLAVLVAQVLTGWEPRWPTTPK